jgi:acetylornithine deacetylase/succinyl-diaminopimelate desuccinylase-like protein
VGPSISGENMAKTRNSRRFTVYFLCLVFSAVSANAQQSATFASQNISAERLKQYADLAMQWEQQYLRIDTTNPPGNEFRGAAFFKKILDQEGIENRVFDYSPVHSNLWARLPHATGSPKRPIILLNHMDVVTSDASHWTQPVFGANLVNGAIYARGAQDMKSEGLTQLMVMVLLKREKVVLDRDVIFLAVADEEADGSGTDWMIDKQRDLLGNAEFLINEGGENIQENGKVEYIGVDVGEKSPFWLHVEAHGRPGHGSRPNADSAPNRLLKALDRIVAYKTPMKVLPVVDESLRENAANEPPEQAKYFKNASQYIQDPNFQKILEADPSLNYLVRNTISLTMLGGSEQTNVVPPIAWANIDVRLLPDEDPNAFLESIRKVIHDPNVTVTPQSKDFRIANYSPTDTALYDAFRKVSAHYFPGAPVLPHITSGYDECQRYRPLGIHSYGFNPYTATSEEGATEHGNDERIRVEEVRRGFQVLYDVVTSVAAK